MTRVDAHVRNKVRRLAEVDADLRRMLRIAVGIEIARQTAGERIGRRLAPVGDSEIAVADHGVSIRRELAHSDNLYRLATMLAIGDAVPASLSGWHGSVQQGTSSGRELGHIRPRTFIAFAALDLYLR